MLFRSGRSIAVQNFNEQAAILALGGFYTLMTSLDLSINVSVAIFGLLVAGFMYVIGRWHKSNLVHHTAELDRLLAMAKSDKH